MIKPNGTRQPAEPVAGDLEFLHIYTLVDVTNSGIKNTHAGDVIGYNQTQNLNVLLQTVGLRAQPILTSVKKLTTQNLSDYDFGSDFDEQTDATVWVITFATEHKGVWALNNDATWHLKEDCNGVAITTALTETVEFDQDMFVTTNTTDKNTYFTPVDSL